MMKSDENRQARDAATGDGIALAKLLQAFEHRVYSVCYRMVNHREDALDLAQQTLLKVIEHIQSFQGQSSISTWIIRIAMNVSISHLRKRKIRKASSLDTASNETNTSFAGRLVDHREPMPDSNVQQQEEIQQLHVAMEQIDDDFRSVLILRDLQQMDYRQMGEVLNLPPGTVKSRLFRARLALRHEMLKLDSPPPESSPESPPKLPPESASAPSTDKATS